MGSAAAGPASIASLGFDVAGDIYAAKGEQATQQFLADRDRRAAEMGRLKAEQSDVQLREELQRTLGRIETTRAAAGADLSSPTTAALLGEEERVGDRDRTIRVKSLLMQASEDEMSASYREEIGKRAMISALLKAGGRVGKAIPKG